MKYCTKCKTYKNLNDFGKNKSTKDGYQSWCKECKKGADKKYVSNNKQSIAKTSKKRRESYAKYDSFADKISFAEKIEIYQGYLCVRCTYCGQWFIPTYGQVHDRIRALNGQTTYNAENRLYCCPECKLECPIYHKHKHLSGTNRVKSGLHREVNPQFRHMVFERDNYTCQCCGKHKRELTVGLHCHHINPAAIDPLFDCDLDNGITLCKDCHIEKHQIPGCGYNELKKLKCEEIGR